jgi:hypothetical protein
MRHWQIVLNSILVSTRSGSLCVEMKSLFNELGEGSSVFFVKGRSTAVFTIWPSPIFRLDSPGAHLEHSECMENVGTTPEHIILHVHLPHRIWMG